MFRELYSPEECSHLLADTLEAEENGGEEAEENFQLSPDTDDFENLKLDFGVSKSGRFVCRLQFINYINTYPLTENSVKKMKCQSS